MTVFLNFDDFTAELTSDTVILSSEGTEYSPDMRLTHEEIKRIVRNIEANWGPIDG